MPTRWHAILDVMDAPPSEEAEEAKRAMNDDTYSPGAADVAKVEKDGETWTLVLERALSHPPEKVWRAITEPGHLHAWAPFDVSSGLDRVGTVEATWVGAPAPTELRVTRAEAPRVLEYESGGNGMRWELEARGAGTRLRLFALIDRRYIALGAAGWHIAFDVLQRLLDGVPVPRIAGMAAMQFEGWRRLHAEYSQQFATEPSAS